LIHINQRQTFTDLNKNKKGPGGMGASSVHAHIFCIIFFILDGVIKKKGKNKPKISGKLRKKGWLVQNKPIHIAPF
jgi:hypothetical protein